MSIAGQTANPDTVFTDLSNAALSAGMALMERRSRAVSDYWRTMGAIRAPGDMMAVQLGYWRQMSDDYAAAFQAGLVLVAEPETPEAPGLAPAQPARAA
ncbi:MAG: hypothetical protein JWQ52_762 [Phenylobacterium sp.]|jgi:hypothetical protein|nr:hypothetical protein [Phenylobacterium sp.]